MEKSLCSIFSAWGRISLTANSSAVCPIIWCCSEKSSGVNTSAVCRSSSRKLPPRILDFGIAVVAIVKTFHRRGQRNTRKHREIISSLPVSRPCLRGFPQWAPPWPLCPLWLEPFENPSRAHPSADAHGHHAIASLAAFQFANHAGRQLRPCTSQGMPQSDRSPIRIHALRIKPSFPDHRQRLRRKRLVQFDHVDIRELQPRQFQRLRDGKHRTQSHFFWLVSGGGERDVARQRNNSQSLRSLGRHHHRCCRAIRHLRRIPCRGHALYVKRRLQRAQSLDRSIGARALVDLERNFVPLLPRSIR